MEIKIKRISLRNFKGTRDCTYAFDGENVRIEGRNGAGKSTVFDAFTWLLFGKDHRGQTSESFEIKTIDPETGSPIPRLDHWVEAVLLIDGREVTLRRIWSENWVKPTGSITDVMAGHNTLYLINGQACATKRDYDQFIGQWMNEELFRLITNPLYFIDNRYTAWKDRRKALLDLVKDAPEREAVRKEFADVVEMLSGRSVEDYRKRLQLEKRANKKDLDDTLARIAGIKEALPAETDTIAVNKTIEALTKVRDENISSVRSKIEKIDEAIEDAGKQSERKEAENKAIWAEITKVQLEMGELLANSKKGALERNNDREQAVRVAEYNINMAEGAARGEQAQMERTRSELSEMEAERGRMASELKRLGEEYHTVKARTFEYEPETICPHCHQEIPAASQEEARKAARAIFLDSQKAAVEKILEKAKKQKEDIQKLDARIAGMLDIIDSAKEKYDKAVADAGRWKEQLEQEKARPVESLEEVESAARKDARYKALAQKEWELRSKAFEAANRPDGIGDMMKERAEYEAQIQAINDDYQNRIAPLNEQLSVNGVRAEQLNLIRQKEQEAMSFANALANDERQEMRLLEFIKADIDSVESSINGLFRVARWRMFDRTIDGGLIETCEVCSRDGIPYRSMNDAMKTLCGMDVIRVFGERYQAEAPIFIDNAEGVLATDFGTKAQVIRLVVKDCDLTTIKE